jgi:hypothetical protein
MYGKIFECIYEGTLYGQWEAIITFQQMIVLCDDEGFIDMTPPALAAKTSIPLDIIQKGIEILEKDDPYSRTPGEDGKRIIRISANRPWGWQIVNHHKYRNMASSEDRKKYMRKYMREYRQKQEQDVNNESLQELTHDNESLKLTMLTHTNTYTNTNTNTDKNIVCKKEKYSAEFLKFYAEYPNKKEKERAYKKWCMLKKAKKLPPLDRILLAVQTQKQWRTSAKAGEFRPEWKHPATWLNGGCWEDECNSGTKTLEGDDALYYEGY